MLQFFFLQNDQIRDAIYNSEWFTADIQLRKIMIMVMCYSHRPLALKTTFYNEASLTIFTAVNYEFDLKFNLLLIYIQWQVNSISV